MGDECMSRIKFTPGMVHVKKMLNAGMFAIWRPARGQMSRTLVTLLKIIPLFRLIPLITGLNVPSERTQLKSVATDDCSILQEEIAG